MHNPTTPEMAGARQWLGLAVLALPSFLVSIDVSVMLLALPHLAEALKASATEQLWIIDIYGFLLAGFMITMGTLGDRIGRRRLLLIGAAAFGLASALAAFAPTPAWLILARAVLGIAGATIGPSVLALITNMFRNPAQRGVAISIWMVTFMGGMTVGPLVGGVLLEQFWWGAVFLIGVPAMVLLLVFGPFLLPEYRDPNAGKLDLLSVALSLLAILPAVYGLKEIAKAGPDGISLAAIALGLMAGIAFLVRQRRLAHPLLDVTLFANKGFAVAVGGMFLVTASGAIMMFNSQYFQLVLGLSPLMAGLCTLPGVIGMVVTLMLAPVLAQKLPQAAVIVPGLLAAAAGLGLIAMADPGAGPWPVVIGFFLFNTGCAPMVTLSNGIVVGSVRPERAGAAAALSETSSQLGFSLGIAALGALGTWLYRQAMSAAVPGDMPAAAAAALQDTIATAHDALQALPPDLAGAMRVLADQAYAGALHVVALICAGLLIIVAGLVTMRLRHLPRLGGTGSAA